MNSGDHAADSRMDQRLAVIMYEHSPDEKDKSGDLLAQHQKVIELDSFSNLSNTCLTEGATMTRKRGKCPENDSAITPIGPERYE